MSWPVSDAFLAALRQPHTPIFKVDILENGQVVATTGELVNETATYADPATGTDVEVAALDGDVTSDRNAAVRRTCRVQLVDHDGALAPFLSSSHLHPLVDRDIRIWRGIEGVPASDEHPLVPLFTGQHETTNVRDDEAGRPVVLTASDRSAELARLDWRDALTVPADSTPAEATIAVLDQVKPGHGINRRFAPCDHQLPRMTFLPGQTPGPWEAIVKFWEAAGYEVFFDPMGTLTSRPIPDPASTPPAFTYIDGDDNIRIAPLVVDVSRLSLVNAVIVRLSAPWQIYGVVGAAYDDDESSPTYYDPDNPEDSPVGLWPHYIEDSFVSDETEAEALAAAKLPQFLGIEMQGTFDAIPHPGLEASDVVVLGTPTMGGNTRIVLDTVTCGLAYTSRQQFTFRRRTR